MKVNAYIDITLEDSQKRDIAIEYLTQKYGIDHNHTIKDGILYRTEFYPGTGFKPDEIKVREATEKDKCLLEIFKDLEKEKYV